MKCDALKPDQDPPDQCLAKMLQTILNPKPAHHANVVIAIRLAWQVKISVAVGF